MKKFIDCLVSYAQKWLKVKQNIVNEVRSETFLEVSGHEFELGFVFVCFFGFVFIVIVVVVIVVFVVVIVVVDFIFVLFCSVLFLFCAFG